MRKYYSEKVLEARLRVEVRKKGGGSLKWESPGTRGVPDRIVLIPGGRIFFVEIKSTGQKTKPLQDYWKGQLEKLGFQWRLIDDEISLNSFLDEI